MYSRRSTARTGTKKVETLLRKFNESRDSDGAGPRKSGQKWEWVHKSLNIANSATRYPHFVGDSTDNPICCFRIELLVRKYRETTLR